MKITQKQKLENRKKLLAALVDIVIQKDLKTATMREIARRAGLGDATIYNYFPTKDAMVYAYYEDRFDQVTQRLVAVPKFNTYTFQEQLQVFFETKLELLLPDREFLEKTFKSAFFTLSQDYGRVRPAKEKFLAIVREIFEAAIEAKEIEDQVFLDLLIQFFWEYYVGIILYWLKDDSDSFESTTLLIDKSIDIASAVIRAGIGNKIFDMGIFLFKNHLLSRMDLVKDRIDALHGMKRRFMDKTDE
ncbi:MAG: TetR family transcriptional regulator [Desulfobacter sp.]|nr:TetR family transcriptional regulator [Desulfobacter sp.]WDP85135.1 MAG: TetR family transcriptional regulator [Desulfobacter sp.]